MRQQIPDVHINYCNLPVTQEKSKKIKDHTSKDEHLQALMDSVLNGWSQQKSELESDLRTYLTFRDEIIVIDGMWL